MYKVTLYARAYYPNGGQVLLDTSSGTNPGVSAATVETKQNEAGSFTFSIVRTHPLYNSIEHMATYVSVEEDGEETFFGRAILVKKSPLTGTKQVTCEGSLAFLLDAELSVDQAETTYTASQYFSYCIEQYNYEIGTDPARNLTVGTINISGASDSQKYKNGSRTQIQSVIKNQLLSRYDGFLRIRRNGTAHVIDWVTQVGATDPQTIEIATNVINQTTTESGEDVFTEVRGIGKNGIELAPITIDSDMVMKYGNICRSVTFSECETSTDLLAKVNAYIAKMRNRDSLTGEIAFVDMKYLDGTSPKVHAGDVFTHITGYEGIKFTADNVTRDLLNPANDKLTLKTDKDLMPSLTARGANSGAATGSGGGNGKSLSGSGSNWYKHIHETDTALSLQAREIEIDADEKIRVVANAVELQAGQITSLSARTTAVEGKWTNFEGTGLYQNKDSIAQVAGKFKVDQTGELVLKEGTKFKISSDGTSTLVGQLIIEEDNRDVDVGQLMLGYHGSYSYNHDTDIGNIVGRYYINKYTDPVTPWVTVTPEQGANPKQLGYYEKQGDNYVKTNDTSVVSGKTYYLPNDKEEVIFDSGAGYKIVEDGIEYGVYTQGNLTGGVVVGLVNGQTTTKIKGNKVLIGDQDTDTVSITDAFSIVTYSGRTMIRLNEPTRIDGDTYIYGADLTALKISGSGGNITGSGLHVAENGRLVFDDSQDSVVIDIDDAYGLMDTLSHVGLTGPTNGEYTLWYLPTHIERTAAPGPNTDWIQVGTFNRAATLDGRWSGRQFIVNAMAGQTVIDTEVGIVYNGLVPDYTTRTKLGKYAMQDFLVYSDDGEGNAAQLLFRDTVSINASEIYDDGQNDTNVAAPTWAYVSTYTDSNTVTFTTDAPSPNSGAARSLQLHLTQGTWSSNQLVVSMRANSSTGAVYAKTTVDAGSIYTNGQNATNVAAPSWATAATCTDYHNTVTFTTDAPTPNSGVARDLQLYLTQSTWSSNQLTVSMRANSSSGAIYAQTTVDASTLVTNAKNSVGIGNGVWDYDAPNSADNNTVTFTTDAPTPGSSGSRSLKLVLTQPTNFTNNKKTISLRQGTAAGNIRAQIEVDASTLVTNAANRVKVSGPTWEHSSNYTESSNTVTFTTDAETPSSNTPKSMALYLTQSSSWTSSYTKKVSMRTGSVSGGIYAQVTVDASGIYTDAYNGGYTAGQNSVGINAPTWSVDPTGTLSYYNTATFTTNAPSPASGSSQTLRLYLTAGGWTHSGTDYDQLIYLRVGSISGTIVAQRNIDGSDPWYAGYSDGYDQGYRNGATGGASQAYQEGYDAGEAAGYSTGYSDGWTDGYLQGYVAGGNHNIVIPDAQIYTTAGSPPSGAVEKNAFKSKIRDAQADNETLVFRVDCGGSSRYFYFSY